MTAQRLPRSTGRAAANSAAGGGRTALARGPGRRRVPPVSWALVFAGLLAGGALSFGAGLITGSQMTTVAYRGALPDGPAGVDRAGQRTEAGASRAALSARGVAAIVQTPAAVASDAARSAGRQTGQPSPLAPPGTASADASSLVSLPQRNRWQTAARPAPEPPRSSPNASAGAALAPPPPPPKPEGGAPQRLTPMPGADGRDTPGGDAARKLDSAPGRAPIWRIAAASDGPGALGGWDTPAAGLAPSAHWQAKATTDRAAAPVTASSVTSAIAAAAPPPAGRYSVQVGAFRHPANALKRAARLSDAGYAARIVHAQATQSRLFMVRLGAFADRPAASTFARRLAQQLDIETWPVAN
ncbi:hypothetical protein CKO28_03650 [Rhodovibrio sodomensis]|uniref:SPOR domain-containing protein n=1 Tax=Rhodovibrio sodomensis TaxID=1088 RepID=A0ABS1DA82_9PROT|nr:SPOR domain-containing protein [Rhodovibrio sodomensis]MBK1667139.1 hypothetical protein [Rhodovibrio sodomensis]